MDFCGKTETIASCPRSIDGEGINLLVDRSRTESRSESNTGEVSARKTFRCGVQVRAYLREKLMPDLVARVSSTAITMRNTAFETVWNGGCPRAVKDESSVGNAVLKESVFETTSPYVAQLLSFSLFSKFLVIVRVCPRIRILYRRTSLIALLKYIYIYIFYC